MVPFQKGCPLIVWATLFYMATLAGLIIPSFFLHKSDEPKESTTDSTGLFRDEKDLPSVDSLRLYLLFMIPLFAALNALFMYVIHYRHIRRQQYRVEVNEGDNLMFSTATRSLFANRKLRMRLRASRIEPLVLYEGYAGILPVNRKPTTVASAAGAGAGNDDAASVFGLNINLDASVVAAGPADSASAPQNSIEMLTSTVENAKDWYTVEGHAAPSMLLKRLRGRVRPGNVTGFGPDTSAFCSLFAASDVKELVVAAQKVNEQSASIRYEISRRYADVLGNNDLIQDVLRQMHAEKLKRLMRRRQADSVANQSVADTDELAENGRDGGGGATRDREPLLNQGNADANPNGGGGNHDGHHHRHAASGGGEGGQEHLLNNPIRRLVRTYQGMLSPHHPKGSGGERRGAESDEAHPYPSQQGDGGGEATRYHDTDGNKTMQRRRVAKNSARSASGGGGQPGNVSPRVRSSADGVAMGSRTATPFPEEGSAAQNGSGNNLNANRPAPLRAVVTTRRRTPSATGAPPQQEPLEGGAASTPMNRAPRDAEGSVSKHQRLHSPSLNKMAAVGKADSTSNVSAWIREQQLQLDSKERSSPL